MALLVGNGFTFMRMEISGLNQNRKMELRRVPGSRIMKVEEYGQKAIIKIMKEVGGWSFYNEDGTVFEKKKY